MYRRSMIGLVLVLAALSGGCDVFEDGKVVAARAAILNAVKDSVHNAVDDALDTSGLLPNLGDLDLTDE